MMKKFLIIGNQTSVTYKDIFPYFKENKMWMGITINGNCAYFKVSEDYDVRGVLLKKRGEDVYIGVNGICWFTNLKNDKNKVLQIEDNPNEDEFLDNGYLNINKIKYIPQGYNDIIAAPPTIVKYLNDKGCILTTNGKYMIIGICHSKRDLTVYDYGTPKINGKAKYARILIKKI